MNNLWNQELKNSVWANRPDLIRSCVDKGANVDWISPGSMGRSLLFVSVIHQKFDAAKSLLELGANPALIDENGISPLQFAKNKRLGKFVSLMENEKYICNMAIDRVSDVLVRDFFSETLKKLEETYTWRVPSIAGFKAQATNRYQANIQLKKFLNQKWCCTNDPQDKMSLAKIVVADWGGIRSNTDETLKAYVKMLDKDNPVTPLKGIASYSKIFSIADLGKYAIYDARVAACLNAVQYRLKIEQGLAFNYVNGRNSIIGHAGKRDGFVYKKSFKVSDLLEGGWVKIEKDRTYECYLRLLRKCLDKLNASNGLQMFHLEMALFSNAEAECKKALEANK